MKEKSIRLIDEISAFYESNPDFNILSANLLNQEEAATLNLDISCKVNRGNSKEMILERLKAHQRLLRIHANPVVAGALLAKGVDSAHKIASMSEENFVGAHLEDFQGDEGAARNAHRKAVDIKQRAALLLGNIHSTTGSLHFSASALNNVDDAAATYYKSIPSYQDMFGSLDYCQCEACRSILSPAAYFVDLMRLVDEYVTTLNKDNIPPGFTLKDRRPDLFAIPLDCANTNDLIPYLQIVNNVLEAKLKRDLAPSPGDIFQYIARQQYPFNLPFNLPLEQIRIFLSHFNTGLPGVYKALKAKDVQVYRESLGLSPEEYNLLTTPKAGDARALSDSLGMTLADKNYGGLDRVDKFLYQTGLNHDELLDLLLQNFNDDEIKTGSMPHDFYVNRVLEGNGYLNILENKDDPNNVYEQIDKINLNTLDRLNRFIRLAKKLGWSFRDLDWALKSIGAGEIDRSALEGIAKIKGLQKLYNRPLDVLCSFWYDVRTTGTGNTTVPQNLFDKIFNYPVVFYNPTGAANLTMYHPAYPGGNPLYNSNVLYWNPNQASSVKRGSQDDNSDSVIRSRLAAALGVNDGDLTKIASYVLDILKPADGKIPLNVPNLSLMYRMSALPPVLGLSVDEFLLLLGLIGKQQLKCLDDVVEVAIWAEWLKKSGYSVYQLHYVITGTLNQYVDPGYSKADIQPLLESLYGTSSTWMVQLSALAGGKNGQDLSGAIFRQLVANGLIDSRGVVLQTDALTPEGLSTIKKLQTTSFVTAHIDAGESENKVFTPLQQKGLIQSDHTLAGDFSAGTDLSYLFAGDPDHDLKVGEVRTILLQIKNITDHIDEICKAITVPLGRCADLQKSGVIEALAQFFGLDNNLLGVMLDFAAAVAGVSNYTAVLLAGYPKDQIPQPVYDLFSFVSKLLLLVNMAGLKASEVKSLMEHPSCYGLKSPASGFSFQIENIRTIYIFKQLTKSFKDSSDKLTVYLAMDPVPRTGGPDAKKAALLDLTGWDGRQVDVLVERFWPGTVYADTVDKLDKLKQCFDMGGLLGVDMFFLVNLTDSLTADSIEWATYSTESSTLLNMVNAKYDNEQWNKVYAPMNSRLNEMTRDALASFMVWNLGKSIPDIKTLQDLYEFLLIDVEMSGCAEISCIKQGISSVQLYIQRCRMNLEPGIVNYGIKETWWGWMSSYNVWEANRKVFLYPENYLDPGLRKNKSTLFKDLQDDLLQGDVTSDSVAGAYKNYFDKFAELAKLKIAGNYYCTTEMPVFGTTDALFIFGRTETTPYVYYYRAAIVKKAQQPGDGNEIVTWTPWEKIDLNINSKYITPVYVFGKLFVFWVELNKTSVSTIVNNNSSDSTAYKATINYSFYNASNKWAPAQTLIKDMTVDYIPANYRTEWIDPAFFDMESIYWNKVYALGIPAKGQDSEKILILYGHMSALPMGTTHDPGGIPFKNNYEQLYFNISIRDATNRANAAANMGVFGYAALNKAIFLDFNLLINDSYVILGTDITEKTKPYSLVNNRDKGTLNILQTDNILFDNNFADDPNYLDKLLPSGDKGRAVLNLLSNTAPTNSYVNAVKNQPGWFIFDNGDESFLIVSQQFLLQQVKDILKIDDELLGKSDEKYLLCGKYVFSITDFNSLTFTFTRLSSGAISSLSQRLFTGDINRLLSIDSQQNLPSPKLPFSRFKPNSSGTVPTVTLLGAADGGQVDFAGAYNIYFWEVFFYIPFLVANSLKANQRFEEAQQWYHYIFNPTTKSKPDDTHPMDRFWQFLPLRDVTREKLEEMLTNPDEIAAYNNDPFDPDAIARLRLSAFQKAVVMRYIDNLLEWGDYLFSQDTWESITQATSLYVMAKDLLGKRPQLVGVIKKTVTKCYQDIKDKYGDEIPQFLIQLENALKPSGNAVLVQDKPFNDINAYFGVMENEDFIEYWDRVEDRLYKIRHCMNIKGIVRQLALFEPPLNPMELVRAAASAKDMTSMASQLDASVPHYRFSYIIERAKNVTSALIQLGSELLNSYEKKDAEQLSLLRATHEKNILNLNTRIKEQQLAEAEATLASLYESKNNAQKRHDYYTGLLNTGLIPKELLHIQSMIIANIFSTLGSAMQMASSAAHLIPNAGSPFAMTYGGIQIGSSLNAVGGFFNLMSNIQNFIGSLSLTMAGYERREQEWEHQKSLSEYDISQIDYQIAASQARKSIAERDLEVQQKSIDQANKIEDFLKSKFTSQDLYQWMVGRLSMVYFQTYKVAFDHALAAEKAYQYEKGTDESFIDYGSWDSLKKGLLAGESLMLSLNQMEKSYIDSNARTLEIEKTISLLQINPKALLDLKAHGTCSFDLSERMFDYDFPGHYNRKIKTISVSIPAVVGPYQNIQATLIQYNNKVLIKPDLEGVKFLLGEKTGKQPGPGVIRSNWRASQQIAISKGINDNGVFQLNFNDERYLPFEGTGVVSSWELQMPKAANRINYDAISDVIINIQYTASNGGEVFKKAVTSLPSIKSFSGYRAINLGQEFSGQWFTFMHPGAVDASQVLKFSVTEDMFSGNFSNFKIGDVYLKLDLAKDVKLNGGLSLSLNIAGSVMPSPFTFDDSKLDAAQAVPKAIKNPFGTWVMEVNKNDVPEGLKDANGFIDRNKLLNAGVILTFDGELNWD